MATALLIGLLALSQSPPAAFECSLLVGADNRLGTRVLSNGGFEAQALQRRGYAMTHAGRTVRTWGTFRAELSSLTWRPAPEPGAEPATATFTCTQSHVRDRPAQPPSPPLVCLYDTRVLLWGRGHVTHADGEIEWQVRASRNELRISASGPSVGFVAAWSDEARLENTRTLEVAGHMLTCWRLH